MQSPGMARRDSRARLNADSLTKLPGLDAASPRGKFEGDDLRSMRSKRSLSISVHKVGKITKLNE